MDGCRLAVSLKESGSLSSRTPFQMVLVMTGYSGKPARLFLHAVILPSVSGREHREKSPVCNSSKKGMSVSSGI
jgi:hypothetical protein